MQDSITRVLRQGRERAPETGIQGHNTELGMSVVERPIVEVGDDDYKSVFRPCDALEEKPEDSDHSGEDNKHDN